MKKKPVKNSKVRHSKDVPAKINTAAVPALSVATDSLPLKALKKESAVVHSIQPPDPRTMLMQAEEEPNYRDLRDYIPTIRTLREKGFSYREIADWLSERGLNMDHNTVYRVYTNSLTHLEASYEEKEADDEARQEADRNRHV